MENPKKGNYSEHINPNRIFKAIMTDNNTLIWNEDFGNGFLATLMWTYHIGSKNIHHLSNTSANDIGVGTGRFEANNDLKIKIEYPNRCTNCYRIYFCHWLSTNEFELKATIYEDNKPTGDFYGATFIRKNE